MNQSSRKKSIVSKIRGITIIESLAALAILSVAVAAPLSIAQRGLRVSRLAKEEVTAYFLAQDAIEHIKTGRDSNSLSDIDWMTGFDNCLSGNTCSIDTTTDVITTCSGTCPNIRFNSSTAQYGYDSGWDETFFTRSITMTELQAFEVSVDVTVAWPHGQSTQQITVSQTLLDFLDASLLGGGGGGVAAETDPILLSIASSEAENATNSTNWTHSQEYSSANDKMLIIALAYNDQGSADVSSITYNSTSVGTKVLDVQESTTDSVLEVWYVPNTEITSATGGVDGDYIVDVSFTGSIEGGAFGSAMFANIDQTPNDSGSDVSTSAFGNETFTVDANDVDTDNSLMVDIILASAENCSADCFNGAGTGIAGESVVEQVVTVSQWGNADKDLPDLLFTHSFVDDSLSSVDFRLEPESAYIRGWIVFDPS